MKMSSVRKLRRSSRGSVLLELAAGVFILMLFSIGVARFGMLSIDTDRDGRAVRSAVDMVWQLDEEVNLPSQNDVDAIGATLADMMNITSNDVMRVHLGVYKADSAGQASLAWKKTTGNDDLYPVSRAKIEGSQVNIDGRSFDLRDDEKLIVVEIDRSGHGMSPSAADRSYRFGMTYKFDPELGP